MEVHDFLLKPVDEIELKRVVEKQIQILEAERKYEQDKKTMNRAKSITEQFLLEQKMKQLLNKDKKDGDLVSGLEKEFYLPQNQQMQVAVLLPALKEEQMRKEEKEYLYLAVKNICISLYDVKKKGITFEDELGRITLAVFVGKRYDEVEEQMRELKNILKQELEISLNILLGNIVDGLNQIHISYHEAMMMLDVSINKKNEILKPQKEQMRLKVFRETVEELQVMAEDNMGNIEKILKIYDTLFKSMMAYNLGSSMVKKITFQVVTRIYYDAVLINNDKLDESLSKYLVALSTSNIDETVMVTKRFIENFLSDEQKKVNELIISAKKHINDHLADELSVTSLSEKMYVSTAYFSRLFKKEMGEGCNEYIVRKRMENAKILLETTNIRSGEIAFKVGYKDINYFSIAFKKFVGISPKEYREQEQKN